MNDFFENYKHPLWQKKRLEVMEAAGFACFQCGEKDKTLNVHHMFYERGAKPWEYNNNELVCLCQGCHDLSEALKKRMLRQFGRLKVLRMVRAIGFVEGVVMATTGLNRSIGDNEADAEYAAGVVSYFIGKYFQNARNHDELERRYQKELAEKSKGKQA